MEKRIVRVMWLWVCDMDINEAHVCILKFFFALSIVDIFLSTSSLLMQRDSVRCGLMQFVWVQQLVISHHHMQPAASPCARASGHVVLTKSDSPSTSCTFWKQILSRLSWLLVIARASLALDRRYKWTFALSLLWASQQTLGFHSSNSIFYICFSSDIWVLARTVGGRKFAIKSNLNPLRRSLLMEMKVESQRWWDFNSRER